MPCTFNLDFFSKCAAEAALACPARNVADLSEPDKGAAFEARRKHWENPDWVPKSEPGEEGWHEHSLRSMEDIKAVRGAVNFASRRKNNMVDSAVEVLIAISSGSKAWRGGSVVAIYPTGLIYYKEPGKIYTGSAVGDYDYVYVGTNQDSARLFTRGFVKFIPDPSADAGAGAADIDASVSQWAPGTQLAFVFDAFGSLPTTRVV